MSIASPRPKPRRKRRGLKPAVLPPQLENGDRLTASEFLRRYEAMPEVKKAELINGIVYMSSPVRITQHAAPDTMIQGWLFSYMSETKGTLAAGNATARLGPDDVPQPDALLMILPECGGRARISADGYLHGGPELVAEIAASSASIDLGEKLNTYRRAGVCECLVWNTGNDTLEWRVLEDDAWRLLRPDKNDLLWSIAFSGLVLNTKALIARDGAALVKRQQKELGRAAHRAFVQKLGKR